jgi:hypothetical protein
LPERDGNRAVWSAGARAGVAFGDPLVRSVLSALRSPMRAPTCKRKEKASRGGRPASIRDALLLRPADAFSLRR